MSYEEILKEYIRLNPPKYTQQEVYDALKQMIIRMRSIYYKDKTEKSDV